MPAQKGRPNSPAIGGVFIIHDPDKEGGFWPGARFSVEECKMMLKEGNFTPGTRVRVQSNQMSWKPAGEYMVWNASWYNSKQVLEVV